MERFVLYFPESEYLLDDGFLIPRRLISWEGYDGCLKEADGAAQAIHDMVNALELNSTRKSATLYERINAYIQDHSSNPDLNADMIADHLNFSAVCTCRVFKQGSGMPDAILRIDAARQKLLEPGGKVNDVAGKWASWIRGTFIRSFEKVEGMTPGAYRAQHQGLAPRITMTDI